jgi:hypothetical protein
MEQMINQIMTYIPNLLGALAILILGWLIALVVSKIIQTLLHKTTLDDRVAKMIAGEEKAKKIEIEKGIAKGVFYLIMLFVIVAFFQTLGITLITEPLNRLLNQLFEFAPKLLGAGVLLLVAWVLATVLRQVVSRALGATKLDERLGKEAGVEEEKKMPLTKSLGDAIFWLVLLLFLPGVLGALGMTDLLKPIQNMLNKVLEFLPNILTAGIIFVVGWFIARIVQRIVTSLLSAAGAEKLGEKAGLTKVVGDKGISDLIGMIVYILILIPVLTASLNALALDAITQPASNMLNMIFGSLPLIFTATLVLIIAYIVGRVISGLVSNVLAGIGFNNVFVLLGLQKETPAEGTQKPSAIAGSLVLILTMFFATVEASRLLGFDTLSELVSQFMVFAGHIILGLVIFGIGLYIANLVSQKVIGSGSTQSGLLALAAKVSIMVLAGAMALRQMGLANEIISLAFGLLFGAVAVAVAIAFGIGGREIAAHKLEEWTHTKKTKQP